MLSSLSCSWRQPPDPLAFDRGTALWRQICDGVSLPRDVDIPGGAGDLPDVSSSWDCPRTALWLVRQWLAVVNDEERTRHLAWAEIEDTWADQAAYTGAFYRHQGYECWAHVAGSERVAETGGHQPYHHVRTWNGSDMSGPRGAVRNWEAASAFAHWRRRTAVTCMALAEAVSGGNQLQWCAAKRDVRLQHRSERLSILEALRGFEVAERVIAHELDSLQKTLLHSRVLLSDATAHRDFLQAQGAAVELHQRLMKDALPWPSGDLPRGLYFGVLATLAASKSSERVLYNEVLQAGDMSKPQLDSALSLLEDQGWVTLVYSPTQLVVLTPLWRAALPRLRAAAALRGSPGFDIIEAAAAVGLTGLGEQWFNECLNALMERGFLQISGARDYVRLVADDDDQGSPDGGRASAHRDAASDAQTLDQREWLHRSMPDLNAAHTEVARLTKDLAHLESDALRLTQLRLTACVAASVVEVELLSEALKRLTSYRDLRTLTPRLTELALRYGADLACYEHRCMQATLVRKRALRNLGFLRTHEKEPDLGEWAPGPWTPVQNRTASADGPHVPKGQPTIDDALARSPAHWDGDVIVVDIAKAARKARTRAKHRAKEIAREDRVKRERRIAKAARKFARAQSQLQAARRREAETVEDVRAWHKRERLRCSRLCPTAARGVSLQHEQLPRLETDRDHAQRLARAKRAREDRAGARGRHACLRARQESVHIPQAASPRGRRKDSRVPRTSTDEAAKRYGKTRGAQQQREAVFACPEPSEVAGQAGDL